MSPPPPYDEEDDESDLEFEDDFESDSDDDTANNTSRWPDPDAQETEDSEQASQQAESPLGSRPSTGRPAGQPAQAPAAAAADALEEELQSSACDDAEVTEIFNTEIETSVLETSAINEVANDVFNKGAGSVSKATPEPAEATSVALLSGDFRLCPKAFWSTLYDRFTPKSLQSADNLHETPVSVPQPTTNGIPVPNSCSKSTSSSAPESSATTISQPSISSTSNSSSVSEPQSPARKRASVAEQIRLAQARRAQTTSEAAAPPPARPPKLPSKATSASPCADASPEMPSEAESPSAPAQEPTARVDAVPDIHVEAEVLSAPVQESNPLIEAVPEIPTRVESPQEPVQESIPTVEAATEPPSQQESSPESVDEPTPIVETRRPSQPAMAIDDLLADILNQKDFLENAESPTFDGQETIEDEGEDEGSGFFISAGFAPEEEAAEPQASLPEGPSAVLSAYVAATGALVAPTPPPQPSSEEREQAVVKLQSVQRGRAARKAADEQRLHRRIEENAAVRIQSMRRGHLARRELSQKKEQVPAPLSSPTASDASNRSAVDEELRRREVLEAQLRAQLEAKQLIMQAVLNGVFAVQAHQAKQAAERAAQEQAELAAKEQAEAQAEAERQQEALKAAAEAEVAAAEEAATAAATEVAEETANKAMEEKKTQQRPGSAHKRSGQPEKRGSRQIRVAKRAPEGAAQKQKHPPVPRAPRVTVCTKSAKQVEPSKPQKRPPVPRAPRPKRAAAPNVNQGDTASQSPVAPIPENDLAEEEISPADMAEEGIFEISEEEFERLAGAGLLQQDGATVDVGGEDQVFEVSEEEFARLVQEGLAWAPEDGVAAEEVVSDAEFERLMQAGALQPDFENPPEPATSSSASVECASPMFGSRDTSPKLVPRAPSVPKEAKVKPAENLNEDNGSESGQTPFRRPPRGRERSRDPAKRAAPKESNVAFVPASGGLMMMMPQGPSANGPSKAKPAKEHEDEYVDKRGSSLGGPPVRSARTMREIRPSQRKQASSVPPPAAVHEVRPPREPRPQASSAPCYSRVRNVTKGTEGGLAFDRTPMCPLDKETSSCSSGMANGSSTWDEAAASMKGGMSLIRPKAMGNRRGGNGMSPQKQVPLY